MFANSWSIAHFLSGVACSGAYLGMGSARVKQHLSKWQHNPLAPYMSSTLRKSLDGEVSFQKAPTLPTGVRKSCQVNKSSLHSQSLPWQCHSSSKLNSAIVGATQPHATSVPMLLNYTHRGVKNSHPWIFPGKEHTNCSYIPENIHVSNIMQTEQFIFRKIYVYTHSMHW